MTPNTRMTLIKPIEKRVHILPLILSRTKNVMPKTIIPIKYKIIKEVETAAFELIMQSPH